MSRERRIVHFGGNVQGVGFRYTACRVAERYDITGYVRNLPDGRVECAAEGDAEEIDAFLRDLGERMAGYIRQADQQTAACEGGDEAFTVRF